ncbi:MULTISPECIES: ATP-binding protein [Streptomyces]|uniref:ATP-binding protein n=1 Tax=Streptomyces TaxID=1883 RepID=UPI00298DEB69|nr:ATP-binding protein [Streptomyces sp. RLB3-17]
MCAIDGLGHLELDRRGAEMLFQVPTGREERESIAVASIEGVRGWSRIFTGPRLCAAIVDGPTFNAALSATGTESYGLARVQSQPDQAVEPTRFTSAAVALMESSA